MEGNFKNIIKISLNNKYIEYILIIKNLIKKNYFKIIYNKKIIIYFNLKYFSFKSLIIWEKKLYFQNKKEKEVFLVII